MHICFQIDCTGYISARIKGHHPAATFCTLIYSLLYLFWNNFRCIAFCFNDKNFTRRRKLFGAHIIRPFQVIDLSALSKWIIKKASKKNSQQTKNQILYFHDASIVNKKFNLLKKNGLGILHIHVVMQVKPEYFSKVV